EADAAGPSGDERRLPAELSHRRIVAPGGPMRRTGARPGPDAPDLGGPTRLSTDGPARPERRLRASRRGGVAVTAEAAVVSLQHRTHRPGTAPVHGRTLRREARTVSTALASLTAASLLSGSVV